MFMHMVLAALFMYALLRSLNICYAGSFVGAVVFTCNGFIMATLYDGQMFRVQAYIWLPLIIFLLNQALKPGKYLNAVMAGLFWGFQILSGSPQDALYTLMAAILFCLFANSYGGSKIGAIGKLLRTLLLFVAFGLGTAAIQAIPAIEFIRLSVRSVFDSYELVTLGSYPPEGLITAVIPDFFGRYAKGDFWVSSVPWSVPLYNIYVGFLPLILLFFISFRNKMDRKIVFFAGALAVGTFFLALGGNTPVYKLIYLLPGFDRIRAPAKIIFLYVFALSLLAGKGMDSLSSSSTQKRISIVFIPILCLVMLDGIFHWDRSLVFSFFSVFVLDEMILGKAAYAAKTIVDEFHVTTLLCTVILIIILIRVRGILNKRLTSVLLCMVILFDLAYMNWGAIRYGDEGYLWSRKVKHSLAQSLGTDKSIFRVGSSPNSMGPNFEMYLGYQTVSGYNPLYLYRYYEYIRKYNPSLLSPGGVWFFYTPNGKTVLMDLLNVKREISHSNAMFSLRESYLPRTFFVPDYEVLRRSEILDSLVKPGFDPKQKVLFELEDFPALDPNRESSIAAPLSESSAEILSYAPDKIVTAVYTPVAKYLFFSEIYYPGWKAYVDERSVPLLRGNYIFRVVKVPKGTHSVTLVFEPLSIKLGIAVTIVTLLLILAIFVRGLVKKLLFRQKGWISA